MSNVNGETEDEIDIEKVMSLATFIFEQNKMQQESKDAWFGHYLAIIAGVAAFATVCLTVFEDTIKVEILYLISGIAILFTGLIGYLFFWIFLCQRANYWKNYKLLNEIQIMLIEKTIQKPYGYFYPSNAPFAKRKHGADFYASVVENILVSICLSLGSIFIMLSIELKNNFIYGIAVIVFTFSFGILYFVYKNFEKKNKI